MFDPENPSVTSPFRPPKEVGKDSKAYDPYLSDSEESWAEDSAGSAHDTDHEDGTDKKDDEVKAHAPGAAKNGSPSDRADSTGDAGADSGTAASSNDISERKDTVYYRSDGAAGDEWASLQQSVPPAIFKAFKEEQEIYEAQVKAGKREREEGVVLPASAPSSAAGTSSQVAKPKTDLETDDVLGKRGPRELEALWAKFREWRKKKAEKETADKQKSDHGPADAADSPGTSIEGSPDSSAPAGTAAVDSEQTSAAPTQAPTDADIGRSAEPSESAPEATASGSVA